MIAITVSTNYIDILPFVYERNKGCFKHWVFVTDKNDHETINFLSNKPNVTVLYWDFQNERRHFDKGGAIRHAQYYVYDKFPNDWYLLIDTDIVLPIDVQTALIAIIPDEIEKAPGVPQVAIFGISVRLDFLKLSDLLAEKNYEIYNHKNDVYGYFQLYKEKYFYSPSRDASYCDHEFALYFKKNFFLRRSDFIFKCYHLGKNSVHWKGGRKPGSDFVMDIKVT
jgi:hypothetical protein